MNGSLKSNLAAAVIIIAAISQVSCENVKSPVSINEKAAPVSMTGYTESEFSVFIERSGYKPAPAEPASGCYIGAYVLSNKGINNDMKAFDEMTEKKHGISVYSMRLGEKYPYEWVLECVAAMKTPYIIIFPPDAYGIFRDDCLKTAAEDFSQLSVPVFVDFYPDPHKYTNDPDIYKDFYRKAYNAFKEAAPNVIFVVSADSEHVYDFDFYYPGDDYTDWVGINIYAPLYKNSAPYTRNYMKDLDYFYSSYQHKKPIAVGQLAISSYSTSNHRYFSKDTAEKLSDFYSALKSKYTRIKAVNYMDYNSIDGAPKSAERDNFSVTYNDIVLNSYKSAVRGSHFLAENPALSDGREQNELFKSPFLVLEDENSKYISEAVFIYELDKMPDIAPNVINGERYYTAELLAQGNIECAIDYDLKKIVIKEYMKNI